MLRVEIRNIPPSSPKGELEKHTNQAMWLIIIVPPYTYRIYLPEVDATQPPNLLGSGDCVANNQATWLLIIIIIIIKLEPESEKKFRRSPRVGSCIIITAARSRSGPIGPGPCARRRPWALPTFDPHCARAPDADRPRPRPRRRRQ